MLNQKKKIVIDGKEYPIAYSLNVMEKIQEKYGSMMAWAEIMTPKEEKKEAEENVEAEAKEEKPAEVKEKDTEVSIKDLIWTMREFINEGIEIENEESGENRPLITHKQAGRIMSAYGMKWAIRLLKETTAASISSGSDPNA